jgi:drug/metabolite transporter (DMT)-like permease
MKNDLLLLLTAIIWGFAFVAQRAGMELLGPFTYNGVRFVLGALSLVPVLIIARKRKPAAAKTGSIKDLAVWGGSAGLILFAGASLQQIGIVHTTAGKAGFITGLYVVLVPLIGAGLGTQSGAARWTGAFFAAAGLYFLSVTEALSLGRGDFLVLLCAGFYAAHVLLLAKISPRFDPVELSIFQYSVCAVLSLIAAFAGERVETSTLLSAWLPIAYGGIFSVGIAYSLQVVAQKTAHPTHAAIILCLEGLFAAVGGYLLLGERFSSREFLGAFLMLGGMITSQFGPFIKPGRQKTASPKA